MRIRISMSSLILIVSLVATLAVISIQQYQIIIQKMHVVFAKEQIEMFQSRINASLDEISQKNPPLISEHIDFVTNYYPEGSKQLKGSDLNAIVEMCRHSTIEELIRIGDCYREHLENELESNLIEVKEPQ